MNIQSYIKDKLWDAIQNNYNVNDFTGAIIDSFHYLTALIREKSGLEDDDGDTLITKAFSVENPLIKVTKCQTKTEKNIQIGTMQTLQGLYKSIRNERSHEQVEDDEPTAYEIIMFIDYLISLIDKSSASFDVSDILHMIEDEHYVDSDNYANLLIGKIPIKKRFDIAVTIVDILVDAVVAEESLRHFKSFFFRFINCLKSTEHSDLLSRISNDIEVTRNDIITSQLVYILPIAHWYSINELARLRIENMLINSISELPNIIDLEKSVREAIIQNLSCLVPCFQMSQQLVDAFFTVLSVGSDLDVEFLLKNIMNHLWRFLTPDGIVVGTLIKRLKDGYEPLHTYFIFNREDVPKEIWEKLQPAYKVFSRKNISEFEDDIPF